MFKRMKDFVFRNWKLIVLLIIGFTLRLSLYPLKGFSVDANAFVSWSRGVWSSGFWNFYKVVECNYPPGYIFVCWILGGINDLFNFGKDELYWLIKIPAMLCDLALVAMLYKLVKDRLEDVNALILAALMLFNPFVIFNSSVWGQIDSLLAVLMVLSIIKIFKDEYVWAVILFSLAVLTKFQALLFCPIYIVAIVKKGNLLLLLKCVLAVLVTIFVVALPFSPAWGSESNILLALFKSFNIAWLAEKYLLAISTYQTASVNAFNIYFLHGASGASMDKKFLFASYKTWHCITLLASMLLAVRIFLKQLKASGVVQAFCASAYFIVSFLFAFGTQMHARYLYLGVLFMLIWYIYTGDKQKFKVFLALSILHFGNLFAVWRVSISGEHNMVYNAAIGLLTIVTIVYSFSFFKTEDKKVTSKTEIFLDEIRRRDWLIMGAITLIYAIVAYINLGNFSAPQTFISASYEGEVFYAEFEKPEYINGISYYYGVGDTKKSCKFEYSMDAENWAPLPEDAELKSVFKWEWINCTPFTAKYIRGTLSQKYFLGELGFYNGDNLVKISTSEKFSAIFDEQHMVTKVPSYLNGTYFDEIYHPRTAYEYLHKLNPYETTHPPLGKIIMSLGIRMFGMNPFGWRCMGTLFGVLMLPIFYIFIKRIFGSMRWASIGTILFALDFMHFSLTRMGTIDSYPVFFILLMYMFMFEFLSALLYKEKSLGRCLTFLIFSGLAFGLGIASKWIAVYSGFGLAVLFFWGLTHCGYRNFKFGKSLMLACAFLSFLVVPSAIYTLSYIPVAMSGSANLIQAMWKNQISMLSYHSFLTESHPFASKWWQWPFDIKPLWAYQSYYNSIGQKDMISTITIMGNPVLWWTGIAGVVYTACLILKKSIHKKPYNKICFIMLALCSQYLPWMFIHRVIFIYHFFASVPFIIMLVLFALKDLYEEHDRKFMHWGFVGLCGIIFCMFYPVLSAVLVPNWYVGDYLVWLPSWVFK